MPRALRDKLDAVFDDTPWQRSISPRQADWPQGNGFGTVINDVRTIVVHETSGWPARIKGQDMFEDQFLPGAGHHHNGEATQLYISGDGTVVLGMELPRATGHARPVNMTSIGSETGHGWGNFDTDLLLGPYTQTNTAAGHKGERLAAPVRRAGNL